MCSLLILPETRLRDARISASGAPLTITRRPVELAGGLTRGCSVSSSEGGISAGEWERVGWTLTGETVGLEVLWIGGGQYIASMSEGTR
jgi:hypothetical protein